MAITKRQEYGQITILPAGQINLRLDTVVEEDGVELSRRFHRSVVEPGNDISQLHPRVQALARAIWTEKVIADFQTAQARNRSKETP